MLYGRKCPVCGCVMLERKDGRRNVYHCENCDKIIPMGEELSDIFPLILLLIILFLVLGAIFSAH